MSHNISIVRNGKTWNGTIDVDGDVYTSFEILKGISIKLKDEETEQEFYCTHVYEIICNSEEFKIETLKKQI